MAQYWEMHYCIFVEHAMQSPSVTCSVTARSPFKEGNIQSIYKYWKDTCCLQMSESLSVELEVMHKHVQWGQLWTGKLLELVDIKGLAWLEELCGVWLESNRYRNSPRYPCKKHATCCETQVIYLAVQREGQLRQTLWTGGNKVIRASLHWEPSRILGNQARDTGWHGTSLGRRRKKSSLNLHSPLHCLWRRRRRFQTQTVMTSLRWMRDTLLSKGSQFVLTCKLYKVAPKQVARVPGFPFPLFLFCVRILLHNLDWP